MTSRRTALITALALVLLGLTVNPAQAVPTAAHRHGHLTPVYRAPSTPGSSTPALRRDTVVGGEPATTKYSTWQVTYTAGFTGHDDAKAAFQAAVDIWASIVHSSVPITVHADFKNLGNPNLLGQAGPGGYNQEAAIGDGVSYYPDALSDALAGTNVYPGEYDISAEFNSGASNIYYGTDGVLPSVNDVDFESIVLHELGHGLGFSGSSWYDQGTSKGSWDCQDTTIGVCQSAGYEIYDTFLETTAGARLNTTYANDSTALGTAYLSPVFWGGANAKAANGGAHVKMYTPNPWEGGSSIAHMDDATYPAGNVNSLMTPFLANNEVVHRPGPVVLGIFQDMGWVTTLDVPGKVTGLVGHGSGGTVSLSWTAPSENGNRITGYRIEYTDNGVAQSPIDVVGTSRTVTGLTDGHSYVFTVKAQNALGYGPASDPTPAIVPAPDTTAPTVATAALPIYTLGSTVGLRYLGSDSGSGIASYDVRYRRAAFNGAFGALAYPSSWQATTATVRVIGSQPGYTYCFSVRSRDAAGNVSLFSAERCTATALDDRALVASSKWTRAPSSAYYLNTVTSTRTTGQTLTRSSVQARRIYLVATTCTTGGTVGVYWNGTLLRTVSLNASSTTYKKVILIKDFGAVRSGTLVIKALNTGRTYIDGVSLSRA